MATSKRFQLMSDFLSAVVKTQRGLDLWPLQHRHNLKKYSCCFEVHWQEDRINVPPSLTPAKKPTPKTLRGIDMSLMSTGPLRQRQVERLGISYPACAFPLQSSEILKAVKLCHLCDLSDSFEEGSICDNSVAVVWLKMVSCEAGPSA